MISLSFLNNEHILKKTTVLNLFAHNKNRDNIFIHLILMEKRIENFYSKFEFSAIN